tara:strand:+ start:6688 stop:7212 length:525 start_codon:yes stop_codon:yes gene_type:complete
MMTPNPDFRELHRLLDRLSRTGLGAATACSLALHLSWVDDAPNGGMVAVRTTDGSPDSPAHGFSRPDGSYEMTRYCAETTVIAMRNLAADPARRFSRFGQETSICPFCVGHLGFGTLSSVIGYCTGCAERLGWPHNKRAAEHAEDALRMDIVREVENDRLGKSTGDSGEVGPKK